jgi:septum formation protein
MTRLVLASTSPFRRQLLEKLSLPFVTDAPDADESPRNGESAAGLVERLAVDKARAVARRHPVALIIGSDQVACVDGRILGKPGNRERAIEQLTAAAGRTVTFLTGLSLLNSGTGRIQQAVETFEVRFRRLGPEQISRYVDHERPFDCAGSFKSEGYGITLFDAMSGSDPNTLIGLPLIRLVSMLGEEGVLLP